MKYLITLIVATFVLASAFAAAPSTKDPPAAAVKIALILDGSATTTDGQMLQAGSWIGPDQMIMPKGRTVIVTASMQVFVLAPSTAFAASHNPLALYCPGCAWGCGKSVGYVVNPNGEMDEDYCNEFKGDVCVEKTPGGPVLHHISFSMPAWVPCE